MADPLVARIKGHKASAEAIASDLERWQHDHADAMAVCDLEDLLRDVFALGDASAAAADKLHARFWKDQDGRDPFFIGQCLAGLFRVVSLLFDRLEELCASWAKDGYEVAGAGEIGAARRRLVEKQAWFLSVWPRVDPVMEAQALADYRAGRVLSAEEAIRELLDQPPTADH